MAGKHVGKQTHSQHAALDHRAHHLDAEDTFLEDDPKRRAGHPSCDLPGGGRDRGPLACFRMAAVTAVLVVAMSRARPAPRTRHNLDVRPQSLKVRPNASHLVY